MGVPSDGDEGLIEELGRAADNVARLSLDDIAILLRRAALQLQIRPGTLDVDQEFQSMMDRLDSAYDAQLQAK